MRKRIPMILRNTLAFLLMVAIASPLFAESRFVAASNVDPVVGRYLVLFAGDDATSDEATADAIARAYNARIEPYADSSVRGAMMHMRPAQARLLSEDVRVLRVEEHPVASQSQSYSTAVAAPAVPARAAAFTPATTAAPAIWSSGAYSYDPAGNVKAIGNDFYRYDGVGRLTDATALTPNHTNNIQRYQYDVFGNLTVRTTDPDNSFPSAESFPVDTATNHLLSGDFDAAGNQISIELNEGVLAYDATGMLTTLQAGNSKQAYVYDANDERVITVELLNGTESRHRYTLRGSDNKIARELTLEPLTVNWALVKDYVYRGGALMASFSTPTATRPDRHYHLDHLGSTRLITDATGTAVANLTYYPFGTEAPGSTSAPGDRLKFTGHERDTDGAAAAFGLDYMHARYYSGGAARFLAVDPALRSMRPGMPQSWNRYSYVINNPTRYTDPTGLDWFKLGDKWTYVKDVHEMQYLVAKNGKLVSSQLLKGTKFGLVFNGTVLTQLRADGTTRTIPAVSGRVEGWGEVHPDMQADRGRGPIPAGRYTFNRSDIQSITPRDRALGLIGRGGWPGGTYAWGSQRVFLTPAAGTNTYGRSGFSIHGGGKPGSAGCIDLCDMVNTFFSEIPHNINQVPVDVDYNDPLP